MQIAFIVGIQRKEQYTGHAVPWPRFHNLMLTETDLEWRYLHSHLLYSLHLTIALVRILQVASDRNSVQKGLVHTHTLTQIPSRVYWLM